MLDPLNTKVKRNFFQKPLLIFGDKTTPKRDDPYHVIQVELQDHEFPTTGTEVNEEQRNSTVTGSSPDGHAERMRSPRTKERSRSGGDDDDLESGNDTKCRHTTNLNLLQTRFPNCRRFLSHTDCQNESDLSKFGFCLVKSYPETRVLSLSQTLTSGNNNEKPDVDVVIKF